MNSININFDSARLLVATDNGDAFLDHEDGILYIGRVSDLDSYADNFADRTVSAPVPDETGGETRRKVYVAQNRELGTPISAEDFEPIGNGHLRYIGIL